MTDKEKARAVVKANDALTKAKNKERKDGTPVPEQLRKNLRKAVEDFEAK